MINTRLTIFETLRRLFKRLFKQADLNPSAFKNVLYAIILNDLKEWEEYVGEPNPKAELLLKQFIIDKKDFDIQRFQEDLNIYRNVNLPQSNYTWKIINPDSIHIVLKNKYFVYQGTQDINNILQCYPVSSKDIQFTITNGSTIICILSTDVNSLILTATNTSESFVENINETRYGLHKSIINLNGINYAMFRMQSGLSLEGNVISIKFK